MMTLSDRTEHPDGTITASWLCAGCGGRQVTRAAPAPDFSPPVD